MSTTVDVARAFAYVDRRSRLLLASLLLFNIVDVITTRVGLDRGAVEQNPLMEMAVGTLAGAIAAKVVLMGIATVVLLKAARSGRRIAGVLVFANVWYIAVIVWNLRIISLQG